MATQLSQRRANEAAQDILEAIGNHPILGPSFGTLTEVDEVNFGREIMGIILQCANRVKRDEPARLR